MGPARRLLLALLVAAALGPGPARGLSYYLLTGSLQKCFQVDASPLTTITIAYSAPDLAVAGGGGGGGDDDAGGKADARRRETVRNLNLVVDYKAPSGQPAAPTPRTAAEAVADASDSGKRPSGRVREALTRREGTIEYTTGPREGLVQICAQSAAASKRVPVRIGIAVFDNAQEAAARKLVLQRLAQGQVVRSGAEQLTKHASRLSQELSRISRHIAQLSGNAEYYRGRESALHDKTLSLQQAARYWPMFRIGVSIAAAYLQTHYVVTFMKRKHIL